MQRFPGKVSNDWRFLVPGNCGNWQVERLCGMNDWRSQGAGARIFLGGDQ